MARERRDPWEVAVSLLAKRGHSTQEVRQRLRRRGYSEQDVAAVVVRLTASGYLDDADYAKTWARSRAQQRGLGPARLARELRTKGIAESAITAALADLLAERTVWEVAERAAARKLKSLRGLTPAIARRRLAAFLERQGFTAEVILPLCRKQFAGLADPQDHW